MNVASAVQAQQVVQSMVGDDVTVSVDVNRAFNTAGLFKNRPNSMVADTIVSVEMYGRDSTPQNAALKVSLKGEAFAWAVEEIVGAAQRVAERILCRQPTWRRSIG